MRADQYALDVTRNPIAFISAFNRLANQNLLIPLPSSSSSFTHTPLLAGASGSPNAGRRRIRRRPAINEQGGRQRQKPSGSDCKPLRAGCNPSPTRRGSYHKPAGRSGATGVAPGGLLRIVFCSLQEP
jgi:hypothetical protein